jgi:hypothetical protein
MYPLKNRGKILSMKGGNGGNYNPSPRKLKKKGQQLQHTRVWF